MRRITLFVCIFISACTSIKNIALTECDHPSGWCKETRQTAAEAYLYAQMSANTYDEPYAFSLPKRISLRRSVPNDDIGFAYSIYDVSKDGVFIEVVIAYRGTEDYKDWWYGNVLGKQNKTGLSVYDEIRSTTPENIPVTVTGHSLGGAIAVEVSLKRKNVNAYVFNTSPRFFSGGQSIENKRVSIVEYGEVLKAIRAPAREATQTYTSIDCSTGNPISQHKQVKLASCLTRIASFDDSEAKQSMTMNESVH